MLPKTKLNIVDAKIYLNDMYNIRMGLVNPDNPTTNPLDSVGFYEEENGADMPLFRRRLKDFISLNISRSLGIDFFDYINLPTIYIEEINKAAENGLKERSDMLGDILNDE